MDLYELNTQEEGEEKRQYSAGSFDEDGWVPPEEVGGGDEWESLLLDGLLTPPPPLLSQGAGPLHHSPKAVPVFDTLAY